MDQERTCCILFLVLLVLLLPYPLSSLQGKDDSASTDKLTFDFPPSFCVENTTLQLSSCTAVVFSFPPPKANSAVSFQGSDESVLFLRSEQLLLDEPVHAVESGPSLISKELLDFKNGGLVTTANFHHGENRYLTVCPFRPRNQIFKKPILSAKFSIGEQFLLFLQASFSPLKDVENDTYPVIKSQGFAMSRPGSSQFEDHENKDIVLGVYTPLLAIMSLFSAVWSYFRRLFKKKEKTPEITNPETPVSSPVSNALAGFHRFTYRELSAATKHFNQSELLGSGRYASVYRAIFRGSVQIYAVKRFNNNASSKLSFEIEATTIHRLRHGKILELRGWCVDSPNEHLLLYDYMHNKSLREALWNRNQPLQWPHRYKIAAGVAEALYYLHNDCEPRVIHSDIQEGNVMLDADFNPKLGDFGLALNGPPYTLRREKTERDPPECQPLEHVTSKLDVYLYGSVLLALCCRRTEQLNTFYSRLQNLKVEGRLLEAVDQSLNGRYNEVEMLRLLNLALQCLEHRFRRRPLMVDVMIEFSMEGDGEIENAERIFHIEI